MKKFILPAAIFIILLILGTFLFLQESKNQSDENGILSKNGLHWHADLSIAIKGQKFEVPADIGIGAVHDPFHTHDNTGQLHLEFERVVTKEDTKLKRFFKNWSKAFSQDCIFEFCAGDQGKLKFTVNGKENFEFENYEVKDGDKIEIKYE